MHPNRGDSDVWPRLPCGKLELPIYVGARKLALEHDADALQIAVLPGELDSLYEPVELLYLVCWELRSLVVGNRVFARVALVGVFPERAVEASILVPELLLEKAAEGGSRSASPSGDVRGVQPYCLARRRTSDSLAGMARIRHAQEQDKSRSMYLHRVCFPTRVR